MSNINPTAPAPAGTNTPLHAEAALTVRGEYELEMLDTLAVWRAVRDRLRPENGGDGISDTTALLLNAKHLRRAFDGAPPPAVLSLVRTATAGAGNILASGYDSEAEIAILRELADAMVRVMGAVLR